VKITLTLVSLAFLVSIFGFSQEKTLVSTIAISYVPQGDTLKELSEISLSGATIALSGKEGRWEKSFAANGGGGEKVEFTEFDPRQNHRISVRLRDSGILNGVAPGKGYGGGEAFIYQIPSGARAYHLKPISCEGKKVDVWASYALVSGGETIEPLGFGNGCKKHWGFKK
jgi:hypothetical protein